jgi:hypothetical protein
MEARGGRGRGRKREREELEGTGSWRGGLEEGAVLDITTYS